MFPILDSNDNELHLSILEAQLITKSRLEIYKRKLLFTPTLFYNQLDKGKLIPPVPTLLVYGKISLFVPPTGHKTCFVLFK